MTDEEKKAIEIIKFLQYKCIEENGTGTMHIYRLDDLANAIKIILNLIEKQQKEIEELKENNKQKYYHVVKSKELEEEINNAWENKIKAEIEEQKNMRVDGVVFRTSVNYAIKVLQSLLEKEG